MKFEKFIRRYRLVQSRKLAFNFRRTAYPNDVIRLVATQLQIVLKFLWTLLAGGALLQRVRKIFLAHCTLFHARESAILIFHVEKFRRISKVFINTLLTHFYLLHSRTFACVCADVEYNTCCVCIRLITKFTCYSINGNSENAVTVCCTLFVAHTCAHLRFRWLPSLLFICQFF